MDRDQAEAVSQHLAGCAECGTALAELVAIRGAARSLEQLEPAAETWHRIRGRLERRCRPAWRWGLAGAAAVAAAVVAVVLVGHRPAAKQASLASAAAGFSRERATAGLAREYEEYTRGIDEAIEECQSALAENPESPRVKMAYLTAQSSRAGAMGRFVSGGD